jgi:4a-hydroxytetrahydrobiopterin dehydratase
LPEKCKPCEGGIAALPKEKIEKLLAQHRGWELVEDKKLVKEFKFKDFLEAKYFLDLVSVISEEQGHHPTITIIYNKIRITLTTHAAGGLTENDFIMAKIIDELTD